MAAEVEIAVMWSASHIMEYERPARGLWKTYTNVVTLWYFQSKRGAMTKYKIIPWQIDPSEAIPWEKQVERLLNANSEQGWDLDRFEEFEGTRYFYFKHA